MSARNTGLFLPGHVPPETVARAFRQSRGIDPELLTGPEAPRVGHGTWQGRRYTHVALRLFEVAGLRLMDEDALPDEDDLELLLGRRLSAPQGRAVFAFYDEETAAGGAAVFADGRLVSRCCYDARDTAPVCRDLDATTELVGLDPSDWIWRPASDTLDRALAPLVGPGIRTDDELSTLIRLAGATPISLAAPAPAPAPPPAPRRRKRDRLWALVRGRRD